MDDMNTAPDTVTAPAAASTPNPGDLAWHLGMILRGHQSRFAEAVAGIPCGVRGFQLLSTVVHHDPANQQALGGHLGIDRTVLTYLIDDLVQANLVERIPAPSDRRARKIIATAQGLETLKRLEGKVAQAEQELLAQLDESESCQLQELLAKLSLTVRNLQPGTNPCDAVEQLG